LELKGKILLFTSLLFSTTNAAACTQPGTLFCNAATCGDTLEKLNNENFFKIFFGTVIEKLRHHVEKVPDQDYLKLVDYITDYTIES
jgi:hypothetical protein